jgi:hypothetical protein
LFPFEFHLHFIAFFNGNVFMFGLI